MRFHFKAKQNWNGIDPVIVFLPGWGFDGRVWELVGLDALPCLYPLEMVEPGRFSDALPRALWKNAIRKIILVGWSMGGYLALDFARLYPELVVELHVLSMRQRWPTHEIEALQSDFSVDPRAFMAGFYRKCFLGYKAAYKEFSSALEAVYLRDLNSDVLRKGLDYLGKAEIQNRPGGNVFQLHGRRDVVAPVDEMAGLSHADVTVDRNGGHPIFLSEMFVKQMLAAPGRFRKENIKKGFSKASGTYDDFAVIQLEAAGHLAGISDIRLYEPSILEIGCGTGNYTKILADKFRDASIRAIDFSEPMLAKAKAKIGPSDTIEHICAEAEVYLDNASGDYGLITSNATVQWLNDTRNTFENIQRLLCPGGVFTASVFGPEALCELGAGLRHIFGESMVLPAASFLGKEGYANILAGTFSQYAIEEMIITREYPSLTALLAQIKYTGVVGWKESAMPFFSKGKRRALEQWFNRQYGVCRLSYQLFFITAHR